LGANYILVRVGWRAGPTQQSLVSKSQQSGSGPNSYGPRVLDPGGSQVLDVGVFSGLSPILYEPAGYSYPLKIRKFTLEG